MNFPAVSRALLAIALASSPVVLTAQATVAVDSATLAGMSWRSIGPANMGGRITDIECVPNEPRVCYVAAALGGIWKTVNAGTTFFPVFEKERIASIGDIAIAPSNPNIVWVGTGEEDSRNSISPGGGVYKSTDGGLTWQSVGLEKTEHVGRIVIHPTNPEIVYIAALGAAWRHNPERGLYKTTDGGRTWTQSKFVSDKAGFIDVMMHPTDPNTLFAASWERVRGPWFFNSGGPGSALWKTTDAGATWTEVRGNGFPATQKGRMGLSWSASNPNIVYAQVEAAAPATNPPESSGGRLSGLYRSNDGGTTWTWQNMENNRPFYYSEIRVDPKNPERVYRLATNMHFSDDGGRSWKRGAVGIHVDFHAIWINPNDPNNFWIGSDGAVAKTYDQGGTYDFMAQMALGQFYAVSYDMMVPYNVCGGLQDNGSWCGPSRKRSGQLVVTDWFNVGGGDGFYTAQDPLNPYIIYSESQGGRMSRRNIATGESRSIGLPSWQNVRRAFEQRTSAIQDSSEPEATKRRQIAELTAEYKVDSAAATRWNWNTPFFISPHNPMTFYAAGSRVFKSVNRGDDLYPISQDLSTQNQERIYISTTTTGGFTPDVTQAETYGTIVALAESPIRPGILYAGTDDGNVWLTRNDGQTWENLASRFPGVPANTYVSRVEPSSHDSATVFVSFENHREGDFTPYVFMSTDFGRTFRSIASDLPKGDRPGYVHVVRQDPRNPNLLYVGTDVGVWVSLNKGNSWQKFMTDLPTVPVYDLKVHPRDRELIAGTHGRSVWIANVAPLQQLADSVLRKPAHLFAMPTQYQYNQLPTGVGGDGHKIYRADNAPYGAVISYRLASRSTEPVQVIITNVAGDTVRVLPGSGNPGVNSVVWTGFMQGGGGGGRGGFGGGGFGGQGAAVPGFPPGVNPRPGEQGGEPSRAGIPGEPAPAGRGGGGGGGGGGRGGGGGGGGDGGPTGPAPTGDYLVTLVVGNQRQSQVLRVVQLEGLNPVVQPDGR